MKPEWCPQEVWNVAMNEAAQYVEWLEPKPKEYAQSEHVLAVSFARALLEAEQRGRRKGMEEAIGLSQHEVDEARVNGEAKAAMGAKFVRDAIRAKIDEVQP